MNRPQFALIVALAVLLASLGAVAITHAGTYAMGAPTENFTIPDPTGDTQHNEIKPPVFFEVRGPSAQPSAAPPSMTAELLRIPATGNNNISGDEQWYLDVDINAPGWLYIYEYYPPANEDGRWIAYKWQLNEPGQWRLGPFRPGQDEPEGQHIYRLRFYSNGQWEAGIGGAQKSSLVYWNYQKGAGDNAQPSPIPVNVQPASTGDQLLKFLTNPVTLLVAPSIIVVIVLMGWFAGRSIRERRYRQNSGRQPLLELLEQPSAPSSPFVPSMPQERGAAVAILELSNGLRIRLCGESEIFGRAQVARSLGLDELGAISRQQFKITFEDEKPFIEDMGSANGTTVNGRDIRGAGPVALQDGDVIEMAGKASMKLRSNQ
jgi:hypothetical protein